MLRTEHADPAWFSSSFLTQVPASKVDAAIKQIVESLGQYQKVIFTPAHFIAQFARGTDDVLIHLDADNKIDGLLFKPPVSTSTSLNDALHSLRALPGNVSYVLVKNGRTEVASLRPAEALAVASAFKLAVITALSDAIDRGQKHWTDVIPLQRQWKSIPTGVLQTWPDKMPLTVATYAAEMISISDNTAADALMRIVGQSGLRPYAGVNAPFLTTREAVTLKAKGSDALRKAFLKARTAQERATVLRRVDALPLPSTDALDLSSSASIEWHYSVRQLCELMRHVARLPLMAINPGVASRDSFRKVAYKGGSDFGVINLTTEVTTSRGTEICLSATVNDSHPIDETRVESAYSSVLRATTTL